MRFAFNGRYGAAYDVLDLLRGDGENEREADKRIAEHHNEEYIGRDWSRRALGEAESMKETTGPVKRRFKEGREAQKRAEPRKVKNGAA